MLFKKNIDFDCDSQLKKIIQSNIFWLGLCIKILLSTFLASDFLIKFFIPFSNYYVQSGFQNPYKYFLDNNLGSAFPYPVLMLYIISLPKIIFSGFIGQEISFFDLLIARLPLLLADFLILVILVLLIKENHKKIILHYWLSPVLIYISYIHGQLDVIPVSILFISLHFLFKRNFKYASVFLGLCIATKTNMILVVPFYFVYLLYSRGVTVLQIINNLLLIITAFFAVNFVYIADESFFRMVFDNKEQFKVFDFKYIFQSNEALYFTVLAYLLLFVYAINLRGFSKDVYIMFLGFSFGIITLMIPPMQGWYYWIMPFFIYFYCKESRNNSFGFDISKILFILLQIFYLFYFLLIQDSDYFGVFQFVAPGISNLPNVYNLLQDNGFEVVVIVNFFFTILQALLLSNCIFLYKSGIKNYSNYKIFSQPFLLGICGDSGAGKTTVANAIKDVFKDFNTTIIRGDDMHKWERGDKNWNDLTHLNPKSNFLHSEISSLMSIKNRNSINRRCYDHDTGKFTKEIEFIPNNLVIFEGLHSFYIKQVRDLYDLKIFVNPEESLRKRWKIDRDTVKRGYSKDKIIKQIDFRKKDSQKFIVSQMKYSDIIIETSQINNGGNSVDDLLRLKIIVTNSFYLEPLCQEIMNIKSIVLKHEYDMQDMQFVEITGDISSQEVSAIASKFSIHKALEDLGIQDPVWDKNYLGLVQLFAAYCIMKIILK